MSNATRIIAIGLGTSKEFKEAVEASRQDIEYGLKLMREAKKRENNNRSRNANTTDSPSASVGE